MPQLKAILDGIKDANYSLTNFIADNLKRAVVKEVLNHASNFGCEYCFSKAVRYSETNVKSDKEKKENDSKIKKFEKKIEDLEKEPISTSRMQARDDQIKLLRDLINEIKKRNKQLVRKQTHSVWPESTSNGTLRTKEEILRIVESLEEYGREQLTADDVKGVIGRSLLLDVEGFDIVSGVPAEYMHTGCLGVVKRCYKCYVYF